MASSGSFQSNTGVACNIKVEWAQTKDTANNKSTITVTAYLLHNTLAVGARTLVIACMGQSKSISVPAISVLDKINNVTPIGTATFTVDHNSDGSKSGTISATINPFTVTYGGVYLASLSASATVTLDTIPRASTFTVSATSIEMGQNITFSISRASSEFTHNINYVMGNSDSSLAGVNGTLATGVATSKTWTIPLDLANYTATATENTLFLEVVTYNKQGSKVGSTSTAIKVKVPASIKPSITNVSATPTSSNSVVNGWGIFVQNQSKAVCNISASGAYGSTIKSYAVAYGGSTTSAATSSVTTTKVMSATTNSITVTVTDSRGRTATKTITVSAYEYIIPSLGSIRCFRSDASGNANEEGTYCYATATKSYASCGGKNTATASYKIVKKADGSTLTAGTLKDGDNLISGLSATNVYIVTLSIRDALGNGRDYTYTLETVSVGLNLYPSKNGGAAFGKYAEKEKTLDIGDWDFLAGRGVFSQGMYVHDTGLNNWGTAGYIVLARLNVRGNWLSNEQIRFNVKGLTQSGEIIIALSNVSTPTATTVSSFTRTGNLPQMYYVLTVGTSSVTVEIIAHKQTYQDFVVVNYEAGSNVRSKVDFTFPNSFESTLRSGAVAATEGIDYFKNAYATNDVVAGYGTTSQQSLLVTGAVARHHGSGKITAWSSDNLTATVTLDQCPCIDNTSPSFFNISTYAGGNSNATTHSFGIYNRIRGAYYDIYKAATGPGSLIPKSWVGEALHNSEVMIMKTLTMTAGNTGVATVFPVGTTVYVSLS